MAYPAYPRTKKSPDNFQKELDSKMRERRSQLGGNLSDDELDSDDELMAGFNATMQDGGNARRASSSPWRGNQTSPHSKTPSNTGSRDQSPLDVIFGKKDGQDDLMKTRRNPVTSKDWTPPGFSNNRKSPVPSARNSKMDSFREEEEDRMSKQPSWRNQEDMFTKSSKTRPDPYDRKTPTNMSLDSIDGTPRDDRPKPTPRSRYSKADDKENRVSPSERKSPADRKKLFLNTIVDDDLPKAAPRRNSRLAKDTVSDDEDEEISRYIGRKSPYDRRQSRSPSPTKKSPSLRGTPNVNYGGRHDANNDRPSYRGTPDKNRRSPYSDNRRSPAEKGNQRSKQGALTRDERLSPKDVRRKSITDETRKSPFGRYSRGRDDSDDNEQKIKRETDRRSPYTDDRKSPYGNNRKSPYSSDRKSPYSDSKQRKKGSRLDDSEDDDRSSYRRTPTSQGDRSKYGGRRDSTDRDSRMRKPWDMDEVDGHSRGKDTSNIRDGNKSPWRKDQRTNLYGEKSRERSPSDERDRWKERRSPGYDRDRRSPTDDARRRTPSYDDKHRRTPTDDKGRRTPSYEKGRRTPSSEVGYHDRRSPDRDRDEDYGRRGRAAYEISKRESPWGTKRGESPGMRRQRRDDHESESDHNKPMPLQRKSRSSFSKPEDDPLNHRQARPSSRTFPAERESSVCREVEKDPTMKRETAAKAAARTTGKIKKRSDTELLEAAISNVEDAQNDENHMKYINPEKSKGEKARSRSAVSVRPKPRYVKPGAETTDDLNTTFNSTTDIRESVYQAWLEDRSQRLKNAKLEEQRKKKAEEEAKEKEKEEKILENTAAFNAWSEKKRDSLKKKKDEVRRKEEEERKKKEDEYEKRKDAEMAFRGWKEDKDAYLKEQYRKKLREQRKKEDQQYDEKKGKKEACEGAFEHWKSTKEIKLLKQKKEKEKQKIEKEEEERRKKRQREKEKEKMYYEWLEKKEKQQDEDYRRTRRLAMEEHMNPRPAWSPASRTVPFGRT